MSPAREAVTTVAGKAVGPVGYGMLGLTKPWGPVEYPMASKVLKTALEQAANVWNGGIHYGTPEANSLHLLKYYFGKYPEDANKEGKIGGIRLSEVSAATIRKAHAVYPVASVEVELSLFTPNPLHNGIVETCHELGIPLIAYTPISRGWLTGKLRKLDDPPTDDFRRMLPRFQPAVFDQNFKLAEAVEGIAKRKGVTTAQVAIGWVVAQGAIPIPGSASVERVVENHNVAALTDTELTDIQTILNTLPISREHYDDAQEKFLDA